MPRIACILNPKARDGISSKSWPEFETALTAAGFEIDIHEHSGLAMQWRYLTTYYLTTTI